MALTEFQRSLCRLIARQRLDSGESYVAGGVALNAATGGRRISRDVDLFHDTTEAVAASWQADRTLLENNGFKVRPLREREGFIEAVVGCGPDSVVVQWASDSAFRFFPLVQHEDFGLTLHPFDLATNKVLALVGRIEARDWVDVISCHKTIQRLGYLAWAASGKDPGFSPATILEQASRTARYSKSEINALAFADSAPDAGVLAREWHEMLQEARKLVEVLPPAAAGQCVLDNLGALFNGAPSHLRESLQAGNLGFHEGCIRGALPRLRPPLESAG